MSKISTSDPHGILDSMRENGSFVTEKHIVYKAGTHGDKYLDKDAHLTSGPRVPQRIAELLSQEVPEGAIIIAPETRSQINLGQLVAHTVHGRLVTTKKIADVHQIPEGEMRDILQESRPRVLVDDILNNGETLRQVRVALDQLGFTLNSFHVMVDRNPSHSATIDIPVRALATVQMDQWDEKEVPAQLKEKPINTQLGKGRNWVPKAGQELGMQFYLERLHKENLGFHLDDGMQVKQMDIDGYFLASRN